MESLALQRATTQPQGAVLTLEGLAADVAEAAWAAGRATPLEGALAGALDDQAVEGAAVALRGSG